MSTENKKANLTPLNENEAGQIEGGFAAMPGPESLETEGINTGCPVNNVATCCVPTTAPAD